MIREQILQNFTSLIETPYVSVDFGGKTFGMTKTVNPVTKTRDIDFITNLTAKKLASGTVNTYTLEMSYVVKPGEDPNYVDKIISTDPERKIWFSYGDLSQPAFSYKKEQGIITNIKPTLDIANHKLQYTISATSSVALNYSIKRSYPATFGKPSDEIFKLLYLDTSNGLLQLFPGMADRKEVEAKNWIARNDKEVQIENVTNASPLEYLRFLVSHMQASTSSFYGLVIHDIDDIDNGQWFEVVNSALRPPKYLLEVDVGYPGNTRVFDFQVNNDTSFALITKYSGDVDKNRIVDVNKYGQLETSNDPSFVIRNGHINEVLKSWWKSMTSFPINATLKTRGLIVPSVLAETIKINVLFFGRKYNYSGTYMVTGQTDTIGMSGYRTQLDLVRVAGDEI